MSKAPEKLTGLLLSTITIVAFSHSQIVLAIPIEDIRSIATSISVRIDRSGSEGDSGTGVIIDRQGNTYVVLTNWHIVKDQGEYIIQTPDQVRHIVSHDKIQKVEGLDLAEVKFTSSRIYQLARRGNSNNVVSSKTLYVAGWINQTPSVRERVFDTAVGRLVSNSQPSKDDDGYSLLYALDVVQTGTSGGAILDEEGQLIGINGKAIRDLRTGTAGLVSGIAINTYAQVKGISIPANSSKAPQVPPSSSLAPHLRLQSQYQDISAELTHLTQRVSTMEDLLRRARFFSEEKQKLEIFNKVRENLPLAYQQSDELDKQIEAFRQLTYQNETKLTSESYTSLFGSITRFKNEAASLRGRLDALSIEVEYKH